MGFLEKCYPRFYFFPAIRSHKMMPREGLLFFQFFLNWLSPIWDPHEMTAHENSCSRPVDSKPRFNGQSSVNKCRIVDPKIIFSKSRERIILLLKCKHAPFPAESLGAYTKFRIYLKRFVHQNKS
jgi:hypothetical protein